jgi:hypothetical protein
MMANDVKYSVLSPEPDALILNTGIFGSTAFASQYRAKRLGSLENKTVYLVDIGFGGGYKFMQALQKWFKTNMPSVTTVRKRRSGSFMASDTPLWEEIKAKGQAAVIGVAG